MKQIPRSFTQFSIRRWWRWSVVIVVIICSCNEKRTMYSLLDPSDCGVGFVNQVVEDTALYNMEKYLNIYTGAGVAAGDINNDGLPDIYFSGNQVTGRLYLNKGNLQFEDITEKAGLITDRWGTGVSMIDINQDGWLDIYVCVAGSPEFGDMSNLLFVNNGDLTFTEKAQQYGIAEKRLTMNASFFDYDKDNDLDLFMIVNPADRDLSAASIIGSRKVKGEAISTDILYRNNGNGTFTDVSDDAGILIEGYSLGAAISDINNDQLPDIYISNDFLTPDVLYINNGDGTFTDRITEYLKHISFASMGNDIADFNNDGLVDIYTLDMLPEDNYRRKMLITYPGYDKLSLARDAGYQLQYNRNVLQLNNGNGTFSEIGFLAGVSSTDWSWSALWADYDNDGHKDLAVTNGFYRDLGNMDYIVYESTKRSFSGKKIGSARERLKTVKSLEQEPLQNYMFRNNGNLTFTNTATEWGLEEKGFSNGACYADLDNDGDLEYIVSCFSSPARVYRNNTNELEKNNFLRIVLKGNAPNRDGIGSKVWLYSNGEVQFQEFNPYRGFESSMEYGFHFGLGKTGKVDSLSILWPDGMKETKYNVSVNQRLEVNQADARLRMPRIMNSKETLFTRAGVIEKLAYVHKENKFIDYKVQPLLPHMFSRSGPSLAVADVNNDRLDDFYIGGSSGSESLIFTQTKEGNFKQKTLGNGVHQEEDQGSTFFDADGDGDIDLYVVSGGSENEIDSAPQQDRLYINDGKGNFTLDASALPDTRSSGSCVAASDYDNDGDLDLFIGGRVSPGKYPVAPRSYILRNESTASTARFVDATRDVCPELQNIGMVTTALWSDFDNDDFVDLIVAGEYMPVTFFKSTGKELKNITSSTGLSANSGWWNCITAGDYDQDGDIDYVAGNLGLNSPHKASPGAPCVLYAKDFDGNGLIDPISCYYENGKSYIYNTRDELISQISPIKRRFGTYEIYAKATYEESFRDDEKKDAIVLKSECFETSYFENKGNGKFVRSALPMEAQFAPVFNMLSADYDSDGNLDILLAGNRYEVETSVGQYDALPGLLLKGNGKGSFKALGDTLAGFHADHDVKGMANLVTADHAVLVLVANNNGKLEGYRTSKALQLMSVSENESWMIIHKVRGGSYRQEIYHGGSSLSHSTRQVLVSDKVSRIVVHDRAGGERSYKRE